MACCGRNKQNITIPPEQQDIINKINNVQQSGVKSNRSRPGTLAKACSNCGTKTVTSICPICSMPIS